ncbi:MAG: DNRLRE domain-containing protein [Lachnospiraceae bacterium]|nr:DNRLRE domain-containing protein [Lachnospiraceae bacterium]
MKCVVSLVVSFVLALGLLFCENNTMGKVPKDFLSGEVLQPVQQVLPSLRTKNSDTYLRTDGMYECVVYAEDKYYEDSTGVLVEFDNTIVSNRENVQGIEYEYRNASSDITVRFKKNTPSVLLNFGGHSVAFSHGEGTGGPAIVGGFENQVVSEIALFGDNYIGYSGVGNGYDIIYSVGKGFLKEYIVLNDSSAPRMFSFDFSIPEGFSVRKTSEGKIGFFDSENNLRFELESLFAIDSAGEYTNDLHYDVSEDGSGNVSISVILSSEYANDPSRVYPIVIDPTITVTGSSCTYDSYVSSRYPTANYYLNTYLRTGRDDDYYVRRTYIKFDMPANIGANAVTIAYVKIKKYSGAAPSVKAYRCTGNWSSGTVTWNSKPGFTTEESSAAATLLSDNWYGLYVKEIVQGWLSGGYQNYGLVLKDETETGTAQWTTFYSSDAPSPNKPELHIAYSAPISINRTESTYGTTYPYRDALQLRMNCYAYALHVYSVQDYVVIEPGFFANYFALPQSSSILEAGQRDLISIYDAKIKADFSALSNVYGSEWTISDSTLNSVVPAGKRKIALVVNNDLNSFHFYFRHSDGTWSQKMGGSPVQNTALSDSTVLLNDLNIAQHISDEGYDDGVRYYLISKSAVIDYRHGSPQSIGGGDKKAEPQFLDRAGEILSHSYTISGSSFLARFDFPNDVDCYAFTPTVSGTYVITTNLAGAVYNVDIEVFDTYGNLKVADYSSSNASVTTLFSAGNRYFIKIKDSNHNVVDYTLQYTHY